MLSQYQRDAMVGRMVRLAPDRSDDKLTTACNAVEYWVAQRAGDPPEFTDPGPPPCAPLRLMPESASRAGVSMA